MLPFCAFLLAKNFNTLVFRSNEVTVITTQTANLTTWNSCVLRGAVQSHYLADETSFHKYASRFKAPLSDSILRAVAHVSTVDCESQFLLD